MNLFCQTSKHVVSYTRIFTSTFEQSFAWAEQDRVLFYDFAAILVKKQKTCTLFLSSYTNTSGSLGEREMLWEHEPQASVSTGFSSSPKL